MRIVDMYGRGRPVFSFEFFPPRSDEGYASLYRTIADLKLLNPDFVSVTWGAGGSTRRKTVELVIRIQHELGITAMAHLSCIGSTTQDLSRTLDQLAGAGIENVLALGGDRPPDYVPPLDGFTYANELVEFIRGSMPLCIGGACYPETHKDALSPEVDLGNLCKKVRAGSDFLISQLFFDNRDFFAFEKRARDAGIEVPIVPGIMPIISVANVRRMTSLSGAQVPEALQTRLSAAEGDDDETRRVGVEWAAMQCRELLERGAPGIHFYTLNRSASTRTVFEQLLG